jgi:phage terminase Nu1 subunit (DNA packaging protein)
MGSEVEEKKGAKATIPLTRTRASVMALRNVAHCGMVLLLFQQC